jgi:2-isopropylmalate synthase
LQIEFSREIQHLSETSGGEMTPAAIWASFTDLYLPEQPRLQLLSHELTSTSDGTNQVTAQILCDGAPVTVHGTGNGPLAAFVDGLRGAFGMTLDVVEYREHSLGRGSDATAVAYVATVDEAGRTRWGVGADPSITAASLRAVLSALGRFDPR